MLLSSLPPNLPAVAMGRVVGSNMLRFLRGETTILEETRKDDLLGLFYKHDVDTKNANDCLADVVSQIVFRYPRMKILEIGAGTGSATRATLARIGRSYQSVQLGEPPVKLVASDSSGQYELHIDYEHRNAPKSLATTEAYIRLHIRCPARKRLGLALGRSSFI